MKLKRLFAGLLCLLLLLCACGAQTAAPTQTAAPVAPVAPPDDAKTDVPAPNDAPAPPPDATALPTRTWPLTVTDDLGREVTLTAPPEHVAAIMASFAETWLLAGGTLSAAVRDAWDDFHLDLGAEVRNLGNYKDVSMELLFEAEADLVIASANTKSHVELRDTLEQAKIPVLYFEVNSFADYLRMLSVCCEITARSDLYEQNGLAVKAQVDAAVAAAAQAKQAQGAPRVLLLRTAASGIHAKGSKGTVLGLMLADLGCENIADGSELLEDLSIERIIEADPDRIFIVQQGNDSAGAEKTLREALTDNPAWAGLTAVKEGRVHMMERSLYHFKPNNRWGTAYAQLEELLYEK